MRRCNILAIIAVLGLIATGLAQEWNIDLDVYRNPDTVKTLTIKTSIYGSDLYDPSVIIGTDTIVVDVAAPPAPPSGFYAFFPITDPGWPITALTVDARSSTQDTIIWTVFWGGTMYPDSVTVDWTGEPLPAHGSFKAAVAFVGSEPDWSTAVDMSSVTRIKAASWMEWIKIRFVLEDTTDITPPTFTNWVPANGAVDVPISTTIFSVDILDPSGIDESSIGITAFGITIPSMFITKTPITGGTRALVNTAALGVDLPACSTLAWQVTAEDMAGNLGIGNASFTTECEDTVFCVSGTVTLEGTSVYSNSVVFVGAYHDSTDAVGAYSVCGVPGGIYTVIAWHEGYMAETLYVTIANDTTLNFNLALLTGSISGTVSLDGMSDHSGAVVSDWVNDIETTTDALGNYTLDAVPLGPIDLHVTYPGYTPASTSFTLHGDTTGVDFYLFEIASTYNVSGVVSLEGTSDFSGTKVKMIGVGFADSIVTASTGSFSFDVEAGTYTFTASHAGYVTYNNPSLNVTSDLVLTPTLDTLDIPVVSLNPPANVQATNRPCYPEFIYVNWREPTLGDTLLLSHAGRGISCGENDPFIWYSPYGYPGGGYAMPFVAPTVDAMLTKVSIDLATLTPGTQTRIHIWAEHDSGGPGADMITPLTITFPTTVDFETREFVIDPPLHVGTDVFYVGWIDVGEYPNCIFVRQDYTTPDTLTWIYYARDSVWDWYGNSVNNADIDFVVEAYVTTTSGSRSSEITMPLNEALQHTKVRSTRDLQSYHNFVEREPLGIEEIERSTPRMRPMEDPVSFRLYRHTSAFSDTAVATLIAVLPDTIVGYIDTAITPGTNYYYGMVANYASGASPLSNIAVGYTNVSPAPNRILIIDWAGGETIEEGLGWAWDPTDSLYNLLLDLGVPASDITVTGEHDRLYVTELLDASDNPLFDLIIIEWNPLSYSGWLGPRPRVAEWHILRDYLYNGGQMFIEGADAMQILSSNGATAANNSYDSLFTIFGVHFYDMGIGSLEGNVRQLTGTTPLFSPGFTKDYSMGHISDYGVDEFEHRLGTGAFTVLTSQLTAPMPNASNGRGVWREHTGYDCKTLCTSTYLASIIDIPVGTTAGIAIQIFDAFGIVDNIDEKPFELPQEISLFGNVPNPFNAATAIEFKVEEYTNVELSIYDMLGKKVNTLVDESFKPGVQKIIWDGTNAEGRSVESGIYFYKLTTNTGSTTRRMVLLK